ncbi:hypothetical protein [Vibrio sp. B1Z05]|uniref:hypothetical protein n=1 Tax=Vibrio sp. B1Z05 TaxID=2654980 RepID=UPI00128BDD17|nr:hypothetical protein [Vibrio sp. B1Z05]MPW35975.1 hypothetical protein [Vibrio sp. B1Z05]
MKYTLFALALTPVLLTGCGGGSSSSDHGAQQDLNKAPSVTQNTNSPSANSDIDTTIDKLDNKQNYNIPVSMVAKAQYQKLQNKEDAHLKSIQHSNAKNMSLKQKQIAQAEVDKWLAEDNHQQIAMTFEDAGFTEQQVYQLCDTIQTSSSTIFTCTIEPKFKGRRSTVYTMHNSSWFRVDANTTGFVKMTYNPTNNKMVLTKIFSSDDADTLKDITNLKTVDLNGVSSSSVYITENKEKNEVTVTIALTMNNPIIKELKSMYLNDNNAHAITQLKLSDNKNFSIAFTKGLETSEANGDDLAVFNSNIQEIITVAGQ